MPSHLLSLIAALATTAMLGFALTPCLGQSTSTPKIKEIWVVEKEALSPAQRMLVLSLQGLVARQKPAIWFADDGITEKIFEELRQEGTVFHQENDPWVLLELFGDHFKGGVLYDLGEESLNVATTLAGQTDCLLVEASLEKVMREKGYAIKADARGMSEREALEKFGDRSAKGIAVEQTLEKPDFLRDFAIMQNAFTYFGGARNFRTQVAKKFGPQALIYGWGNDELEWVDGLSKGEACGIPADWCVNLSSLAADQVPVPRRHKRYPAPAKPGERIVCFVMSDGDNIQWLTNGFSQSPGFWASEHRGKFSVSWEFAPVMSEVAPRAMRYFYNSASKGTFVDDFVCGPSGQGYTFPTSRPDRRAFAEQTNQALADADLSVISFLDAHGDMSESAEMLDQPNVLGILYKDYVPYNKFAGKTFWHAGKPCMSYRYLLWEQKGKPDWTIQGVADAIASQPAEPTTDIDSYALINVHAWSFDKIGGPMEAVKRTIDLLPEGTRVVTAEEFVILLRNNFGTPVPAPGEKSNVVK